MLSDKMRKKIACNCHNVSYGKIYDAVKKGARAAEQVASVTGASTGCGKCRELVEHLVKEFAEDMKEL